MTPLQERVFRMVRRESLIPDQGRVLVALSGGADSVALTLLLRELATVAGFVVAGVVHLNHQLREAAAEDERFCRALASRLSLKILVGSADVRAKAKREKTSVEEAGHRERHAFFRHAVAAFGADCVATAHTRHDQAETYLMRLLRGAGPVGLSGIHPRFQNVIRPLLDVSKSELLDYLSAQGQLFREDETNSDLGITRNRIRHELIPFLECRFSPSVVDTLSRDAKISRYDADWLESEADAASSALVTHEDGVVLLDQEKLSCQPVALAHRIAKRALESATGRDVGFNQVERLLALACDTESDRVEVDFPGCRVTRDKGRVAVCPPRPRLTGSVQASNFAYRLRIPGEVEVPEAGLTVSIQRVTNNVPITNLTARGASVYVAGGRLTDPLIVRNWHPGDAFRPLGLGGRKKVQDLFVDNKVDRFARQVVPIVADKRRGIVWVVGHTVADDFRITSSTEGMLLLEATRIDVN